ncbi:MAG TPA: hypothetical protein VL418_02090 [Devosiaceae bacterium]|jgi:hypothetical protein|nr:hypothetical protein [Devosiaceae bacterium]
MRIEIARLESREEIEFRRKEDAARLSERYDLPRDVAERIVAMAKNIDQAHSIASLMK